MSFHILPDDCDTTPKLSKIGVLPLGRSISPVILAADEDEKENENHRLLILKDETQKFSSKIQADKIRHQNKIRSPMLKALNVETNLQQVSKNAIRGKQQSNKNVLSNKAKYKFKYKESLNAARLQLVDLRCHKLIKLLEEKRQLRLELSSVRAEKQSQYQRLLFEMQQLEEYYLNEIDTVKQNNRNKNEVEVKVLLDELMHTRIQLDEANVKINQRLIKDQNGEHDIKAFQQKVEGHQKKLEAERESLSEKVFVLTKELKCLEDENQELRCTKEKLQETTHMVEDTLRTQAKVEMEIYQKKAKENQDRLEVERETLAERVFALTQEVTNLNEERRHVESTLMEAQQVNLTSKTVWETEKAELLELLEASKVREDDLRQLLQNQATKITKQDQNYYVEHLDEKSEEDNSVVESPISKRKLVTENFDEVGNEGIEYKENTQNNSHHNGKLEEVSDSELMPPPSSVSALLQEQEAPLTRSRRTKMLLSKPVREKVANRKRTKANPIRRVSLLEPGPLPPIIEQAGDEISVNSEATSSAFSTTSSCSQGSKKRKKKKGLYSAFTAPKLKTSKRSCRF